MSFFLDSFTTESTESTESTVYSSEGTLSGSSFSNDTFIIRKERDEPDNDKEEFERYEEKTLREMGYIPKFEREWSIIPQTLKSLLPKKLKHLLEKRINADLTIYVNDEEINLHLLPLKIHSSVFRGLKNERCIRLYSQHLTVNTISKIYKWIIKPNSIIQRQNVMDMLKGSILLKMKELYTHICAYICSNELFVEDAAFTLFTEARVLSLPSIELMLLKRISKFFMILVSSNDFYTLTAYELTVLVQSQYIGVNSEIEIFLAVIHWVAKDFEEREQYLLNLFKNIRFELIPAWYLVQFRNDDSCEIPEKVMNVPDVTEYIDENLTFGIELQYYPFEKIEFPDINEDHSKPKPLQRIWIFDENCSYHHALHCPHKKYFSYTDFKTYLGLLQIMHHDYFKEFITITEDSTIKCCNLISEVNLCDDTTIENSSIGDNEGSVSCVTDITLFVPSDEDSE